eukprot:g7484.t1
MLFLRGPWTKKAAFAEAAAASGASFSPQQDAAFNTVLIRIQQELAKSGNNSSATLEALTKGLKPATGGGLVGGSFGGSRISFRPPSTAAREVEAVVGDELHEDEDSDKPPRERRFMPAEVLARYLERKIIRKILDGESLLLENNESPTASAGSSPSSAKKATGPAHQVTRQLFRYHFDARDLNSFHSEEGWTILMWLAHLGSREERDSLNDCGKVGCCEEEQAPTPAGFLDEVFEMTKLLLEEFGADPNVGGKFDDVPPLMFAVEGANERLIDLLLAHGADPWREDEDGDSVAKLAAELYEKNVCCVEEVAPDLVGLHTSQDAIRDPFVCRPSDAAQNVLAQMEEDEKAVKKVLDYSFLAKYDWVREAEGIA